MRQSWNFQLLGDRTLSSGNSASAQAGALLPEQEGDNIVQTKLGNKACWVLDLVVIAVLSKAVVVAVLHLGVVVADLLLGVIAGLHLELLGVVPDDVRVVDLQLLLVDVAGVVVLAIPEVFLIAELKLGE